MGLVQTAPAFAQADPATQASDPSQQVAETPDGGGIEEIVVTAERRTSTIQKTPIAITAVTGDEIRERQLNSVGDVLAQTPGIVVQNSSKGQAIFIRGIGSTGDTANGGDPAVNLNIDGVYQQQAIVVRASTFDVNRIEALRGPQGTLYGRNATAGSVNVITNDPKLGENSGYFNIQLGNYQTVHTEGAANVSLSDDLAARLAFTTDRRDGYYSNGGDSADRWATRGKLKYEPNDRLTLTLTGLYAEMDGNPPSTVPAPLDTSDPYNTTYPAYDGTNGNPYYAPLSGGPTVMPVGVRDVNIAQVYAQLDYDLGFGTFTLLPSYNYTRQYQDTAQLPLSAFAQDYTEKAKSIEARIASPASSPVKWVAGLYGYESDTDLVVEPEISLNFRHNPVSGEFTSGFTASSLAAFGQVTVPVTDYFRLTGGARYTWDRKGTDNVTVTAPSVYLPSTKYRDSYESFTYKGGIEFDVGPQSLLYAQVSTGYKAGGINPANSGIGGGTTYEPEKLTAYEAGIKNRFFNNAVQFNLSAYYYNYKNYQARLSAVDCSNSQGFSLKTINAAKLTNYGGEAELTVAPTRHDRVSATASYMHARGSFDYDAGICNVATGDITHDYIVGTFPLANAPEWSGTVSYERWFDLPGGATLTARGDMRWSSSYTTSIDVSEFNHQGSFTRTDASLTYSAAGDSYSLRAFVRNIENDTQILYTLAPPFPFAALQLSDPRTYGVAFSAKF